MITVHRQEDAKTRIETVTGCVADIKVYLDTMLAFFPKAVVTTIDDGVIVEIKKIEQ